MFDVTPVPAWKPEVGDDVWIISREVIGKYLGPFSTFAAQVEVTINGEEDRLIAPLHDIEKVREHCTECGATIDKPGKCEACAYIDTDWADLEDVLDGDDYEEDWMRSWTFSRDVNGEDSVEVQWRHENTSC